jgi:hypothetical protein
MFDFVDLQRFAGIDHLPALVVLERWTARHLVRDQDIPPTGRQGKRVRLKCPNEPVIEPLHQMPIGDCVGELHSGLSKFHGGKKCSHFTAK